MMEDFPDGLGPKRTTAPQPLVVVVTDFSKSGWAEDCKEEEEEDSAETSFTETWSPPRLDGEGYPRSFYVVYSHGINFPK